MWKEGSLKVYDSILHYWLEVHGDDSSYGIDGGKISKLMLKRNGEIVCNYDRGWDMKAIDEETQIALEILLHSENY